MSETAESPKPTEPQSVPKTRLSAIRQLAWCILIGVLVGVPVGLFVTPRGQAVLLDARIRMASEGDREELLSALAELDEHGVPYLYDLAAEETVDSPLEPDAFVTALRGSKAPVWLAQAAAAEGSGRDLILRSFAEGGPFAATFPALLAIATNDRARAKLENRQGGQKAIADAVAERMVRSDFNPHELPLLVEASHLLLTDAEGPWTRTAPESIRSIKFQPPFEAVPRALTLEPMIGRLRHALGEALVLGHGLPDTPARPPVYHGQPPRIGPLLSVVAFLKLEPKRIESNGPFQRRPGEVMPPKLDRPGDAVGFLAHYLGDKVVLITREQAIAELRAWASARHAKSTTPKESAE